MVTISEGAFAKVNLTLDVLGKREDGYHNIKSIMQTISLHDDVTVACTMLKDKYEQVFLAKNV